MNEETDTQTPSERPSAATDGSAPKRPLTYILVMHGAGTDPALVGCYEDPIARNRATMYAVFGECAAPHQEQELLAILKKLEEEKWWRPEGDPPLQWIDADTVIPRPVLNGAGCAAAPSAERMQ